jgi:hypothetical protein
MKAFVGAAEAIRDRGDFSAFADPVSLDAWLD